MELRKITTPRLTTACRFHGRPDGRKLLLIHGNASSSVFYEHIMERLEDKFCMAAPDLRCFGDSDALPVDATRGMINEEFLAKMKPGAALLNFARGELADNDAVKAALRSGHLRAYVTDFPNEALLGVKGVIAIPHLGASTPESEDNCVVMACRQIDMYLKNGAIRNSVNYPACDLGAGDGQRIAVLHANVPNMVGQITSAIAHDNINIDNMTNSSKGKFAYTVLHLDDVAPEDVIQSLSKVQGVYGVRVL